MVNTAKSVSSFTQNGLRDFLLQRITAVYMGLFILGFLAYLMSHQVTDYYAWHKIFQSLVMRVCAILFFAALVIHTQIGLWSVITDYLKDAFTRLIFLVLVSVVLFASLIWGIVILWS